VAAIRATGVPATTSYHAGPHLCNQVFYGVMHMLATEFPGVRGGFAHVPPTPDQVGVSGRTTGSLSVKAGADALGALVDTALAAGELAAPPTTP
jgi:pyroglutamyl-peptidase